VLGLDTNVLVRFLVRDDPQQFEKARRLIKRESDRNAPVLISLRLLLEIEFVLRRRRDRAVRRHRAAGPRRACTDDTR
jgi:predicted nucleic acid-binding protein